MPKPATSKIFIGIDPGASGGIVLLHPDATLTYKMPETERDIWDILSLPGDKVALIEKVGGFIQGNPAPGSAMFNFGANYGGLRMALVAAGIPFEAITPQSWQKEFGIATKGKTETKTQFKNRIKACAQRLYPKIVVTLPIADALLIALSCRRRVWR
jgi:hypothetical protein